MPEILTNLSTLFSVDKEPSDMRRRLRTSASRAGYADPPKNRCRRTGAHSAPVPARQAVGTRLRVEEGGRENTGVHRRKRWGGGQAGCGCAPSASRERRRIACAHPSTDCRRMQSPIGGWRGRPPGSRARRPRCRRRKTWRRRRLWRLEKIRAERRDAATAAAVDAKHVPAHMLCYTTMLKPLCLKHTTKNSLTLPFSPPRFPPSPSPSLPLPLSLSLSLSLSVLEAGLSFSFFLSLSLFLSVSMHLKRGRRRRAALRGLRWAAPGQNGARAQRIFGNLSLFSYDSKPPFFQPNPKLPSAGTLRPSLKGPLL